MRERMPMGGAACRWAGPHRARLVFRVLPRTQHANALHVPSSLAGAALEGPVVVGGSALAPANLLARAARGMLLVAQAAAGSLAEQQH